MTTETKVLNFQAGSTVVVQGSPNQGYFYIVREGNLTVHSGVQFLDKELSRFEKGDTFGLVSALTTGQHLGTIHSQTNSSLIRVPISSLGDFLREHREICLKLLNFYSKELKALDKHLANLNSQSSWDNRPEKLYLDHQTYKRLNATRYAGYSLARFVEWVDENPDSPGREYLPAAKESLAGEFGGLSFPKARENKFEMPAGEIVFIENEPSEFAYIILEGSVKVTKLVHDKEFVVAVLGPGEIVGELSLLDNKPYSASAVCKEKTSFMRLSRGTFIQDCGAAILQKIFESMARRIWFSHQRLAILKVEDPCARMYFFLLSLHRNVYRLNTVNMRTNYEFHFSVEDLRRMCGLLKVKAERLEDFYNDANIKRGKNNILILDVGELENRVLKYKPRAGKDLDNLFH